jgi:protoporphyrinogen/coproporphyrinogen III oxidase
MIVILGAGLTGLALGHELERRGADFTILEADVEPGGVIRSRRVEGRVLELGPQRGRLTPAFRALVEELGLADELLLAPAGLPLLVYARGRLRRVPFSLRDALAGDLLPWSARLRALGEPFTAPAEDDETVAAFFRRKFGRRTYQDLLGPLYGGLFASDPADMLMRFTLRGTLRELGIGDGSLLAAFARRGRRIAAAPACSFRDGMQALPLALQRRHHARVRLGSPATALRPADSGWIVETAAGPIQARAVVLTVPAGEAARLLEPHAGDAARRLRALVYNPLAMVHLLADACQLRGFGFQVSLAEALETRGVTFNDALFQRHGLYTAFLGGAKNRALPGADDATLGTLAADEFHRVTGCRARPIHVSRPWIPAWDRSWRALDGLRLPAGIHLATNYESRVGIPGRFARARALAAILASAARG